MIRYFDTAYIAKLYLLESDSGPVRQVAADLKTVACCEHGRVEVAYVFHRKLRESAITREGLEARMDQMEKDTENGFLQWLPMNHSILNRSFDSVRRLSPDIWLRAADALHLVSASENGFETIFSNDRHLLEAAPAFGLRGKKVT